MAANTSQASPRVLPAGGRKGRSPKSPYSLDAAGSKWWTWAWGTPQATAWDAGALYTVARRAQLEDDVAALDFGEVTFEIADLFAGEADRDAVARVEWALSTLKRSASGKLAIEKEMRELDGKLGLSPRAMADLGWRIGEPKKETDGLDDLTARRSKRLASGGSAA